MKNIITVKEKLINMLIKNGMFRTQAEEVLAIAIPELNKLAGGYQIQFDTPATDYPLALYDQWFKTIKPIALDWIDKNKPKAWFRDMFV